MKPLFSFRLGNFSLNRGFWAAISIVMACSLALGIALVARSYQHLESSRNNLAALAVFRLALDAAARISAERGPTNRVLGEDSDPNGVSWRLLRLSRAATDAALDKAAATASLADSVPPVRQALDRARRQVDALAGKRLAARSTAQIAEAVETMFGVYDAAQPLIERGMAGLLSTDLVDRALVMRMLSELRDYAERLGSHLVIPMIHGESMDENRRVVFEQTRGRVWELWNLVAQITETSRDPDVSRAHDAVVTHFAENGKAILRKTLGEGHTRNYSTTATEFTAGIVAVFVPLEELRDAFIDSAMDDVRANAEKARRALAVIAVSTGLALLFEFSLLLASQKLLFRPLLAARKRIIELSQGRLDETIDYSHSQGEIRELYEALASLREKLIERVALTEQFRWQAETDGLTGVLNRRALDGLAESLTQAGTGPKRLALIMLDIDHFKTINDTYGHTAGDEVLKETARRMRATLRHDDILARFGGEEFAVILRNRDDSAPDIAERLRQALQDTPFQLSSQSLQVTASFGAVVAEVRPGGWPQLVAAADDALYRAKEAGRNRVVAQNLM